jgi:predicted nucleotidyltransferase
MRLSQLQHDIIIQETKKMFGISVTIRLFGSRVNDKLKGGDIDLFLEFPNKNPDL